MTREEAIHKLKYLFFNAKALPNTEEALSMAIEALEQEPILDKLRAEIFNACSDSYHMPIHKLSCEEIFEIIDKYKAESEG